MNTAAAMRENHRLLLTLKEVSELVSHSHNLDETLQNIVHHIQQRFGSHVCSVYLINEGRDELVLRATVGLKPACVGAVRMKFSEGLTGLTAELKEPVNEEDAFNHPRFRYFPETGEELFRSFLGVPMIQGGEVQGVLVIQHRDKQRYFADHVSLLVGIAAQLAVLVTNARLNQLLGEAAHRSANETSHTFAEPTLVPGPHLTTWRGIAASGGVAQGRAVRFEPFDFQHPHLTARLATSPDEEWQRFLAAVENCRQDINQAAIHLAELLGDQFGALLQAQRLMLEDSTMQREIQRRLQENVSAEQAAVHVCKQYLQAFQKLQNPNFYERIYDIKDVFRRLLNHLVESPLAATHSDAVIIVAHEVSLLELFTCDLHRVCGVVIEKGGAFSHVAILARSLGIPMLTNLDGIMQAIQHGDELLLDAERSTLVINPSPQERSDFTKRLLAQQQVVAVAATVALPLEVLATVNLLPEIKRTVDVAASGVGLYRSEFLELARRSFPTEEEQFAMYCDMLALLGGRPLTLRTFDLRAEKLYGLTANPRLQQQAWEWRLVEHLPHVQALLHTQLRAALRAAQLGPLRLLFPMITTDGQFRCALDLLQKAKESLAQEGQAFADALPVGIMIEVPVAAMALRWWLPHVQFLAVGSNDLLHALLGLERGDEELRLLKSPLQPGYLRTIGHLTQLAERAQKPVTVCGESAGNYRGILALLALGVTGVSVPPNQIPALRQFLQAVQPPADRLALRRQLMWARSVPEVEGLLEQHFPVAYPLTID